MNRKPYGSRSAIRKSGSIAFASRLRASIRATWAFQTASDAGSPRPIACASVIAAMGRPGMAASTRAIASASSGILNRRTPHKRAVANARPNTTTSVQNASSGSQSCQPNIKGASANNTTVQSGQNARKSLSATIPKRVARTGHFKWRNWLVGVVRWPLPCLRLL